ncbi:MAG: methyltransferase domain-containing protein [Mariprofundaceae bacterium]|nr:methyltransferase domain-containing protein [Mariprofundaceae bacterium]
MPAELEQCPCPMCGESAHEAAHYDFSPYRVVQCSECGLWYLSPRLNEAAMLAQYSDDAYFEGSDGLNEGYSDYALQEKPLRATFRRFLKQLDDMGVTGGTLLEVGCGYGYLLGEARSYFDRTVGTDFSSEAVERAKPLADTVCQGGVDALPEGEKFDCIIAVEVIEHVYDPNRFVARLAARLKPGGWLVMVTPDMGSWWRRVLGRHWPSFKLPEHVVYYDRDTLTELFERNGFDSVRPMPFPHAFPLAVVLEKMGIHLSSKAGEANIWIPGVVLSMAARLK